MDRIAVALQVSQGDFRTFGPFGPAYEVLSVNKENRSIRVQVLETGEQLDYAAEKAVLDPEAI